MNESKNESKKYKSRPPLILNRDEYQIVLDLFTSFKHEELAEHETAVQSKITRIISNIDRARARRMRETANQKPANRPSDEGKNHDRK